MSGQSGHKRSSALITGCSKGGLGDALAREMHRKGYRVFATARNTDKAAHLEEMGIEVIHMDVENAESVRQAARKISSRTGGNLDFLFNNAAQLHMSFLMDSDIELSKGLFDVNVWGVLRVTQAFLPLLMAAKGRVVNIGSIFTSWIPWRFGVYNASKAALEAMSGNMRRELAPLGVTVLYVTLGLFASEMLHNMETFFPGGSIYSPVREEMNKQEQKGKDLLMASPESIARPIARNATAWWPTKNQWTGPFSTLVWFEVTFFPMWLRDWFNAWHGGFLNIGEAIERATSIKTD